MDAGHGGSGRGFMGRHVRATAVRTPRASRSAPPGENPPEEKERRQRQDTTRDPVLDVPRDHQYPSIVPMRKTANDAIHASTVM